MFRARLLSGPPGKRKVLVASSSSHSTSPNSHSTPPSNSSPSQCSITGAPNEEELELQAFLEYFKLTRQTPPQATSAVVFHKNSPRMFRDRLKLLQRRRELGLTI